MASRKHLVAMLPRTPIGSRKCGKRGQKPGRLRAPGRPTSPFLETKEKKNSLKMRERSGNVYENKGRWYVVCGERKRGTGGWALGTGGLMASRRSRVLASPTQFVLRLKKAYQPQERISFLTERSGNVYENKGPAFIGAQ